MSQSRKRDELPWMQPAADLIVREGLTLREACTQLAVPLTTTEAENTYRSKTFQRVLRSERNRFYLEIASNPEYHKRTVVGQMLLAIEKLMEAGEYEKALEGGLKVSKLEGWVGPEGSVNVFAGLSGREMEDLKTKLKERLLREPERIQ